MKSKELSKDDMSDYITTNLPAVYHTAAESRQVDHELMQVLGVSAYELMQRASAALVELMMVRFQQARQVLFLAGKGNNGGDALIAAAMAQKKGYCVAVLLMHEAGELSETCQQALRFAQQSAVPIFHDFDAATQRLPDLVVDGLLGTGFSGELHSAYQQLMHAVKALAQPVLAIDIPSGLCADSGKASSATLLAAATLSFITVKRGVFFGDAPTYCGELWFADLGADASVKSSLCSHYHRGVMMGLSLDTALPQLPPRGVQAHKGSQGHLLVIGGHVGMLGAVLLSARAALVSGTGLVSVVTRPEHATLVAVQQPELMSLGVVSEEEISSLAARASAIVIGPGLAKDAWSQMLLKSVLQSQKPLVIDADALNLLAQARHQPSLVPMLQSCLQHGLPPDTILTPHPGEAARLLNTTTEQVQAHRVDKVQALSQTYGAVTVLKGAGTLIAPTEQHPTGEIFFNHTGNPGMAIGGMGDVLSGLIGALLAQQLPALEAAKLGVVLHGAAGDDLAEAQGEIGLLPSELITALRARLNRPVALS